jgi:signal transduction histidine kinase
MVDDEPSNLLALEAILEPLGQRLIRANSGAEALRHVLDQDFAVILLDVQMPELDGFETAAMIRDRERSRHIPIVFLTGIGRSSEWVFRGYLAGAIDYLMKPLVPDILRAKVEIFVELAKARRQLQAEMTERSRVAQEVQELNRILKKKNAELAEANAELDAFNHTVSHDLQGPLRHIQGYIGMLKRSLGDRLEGTDRRHFDNIGNAATRMNVLVTALLSFCRIGRMKLVQQPVDMDRLVAEVIESLAPDLKHREIGWEISPLQAATGDEALLRQVWVNLIANAVKYSRHRQPARIRLSSHAGEAEIVYVIKDNGVGFDMKQADRLFGVFERLHGEAEFEGTGIGLANVRRIVERHGGQVRAEGVTGEGATFQFTLPMVAPLSVTDGS